MRILVTGARGFIGSFLVEALLTRGDTVRCLLRDNKKAAGWLSGLALEIVTGDINDKPSLQKAVRGVDSIFHVAGITKARNRSEFDRINFEGTQNLLEAAHQFNPDIRRFVLVSSLAAAGPSLNGHPVTELDTPHPISNYGQSKLKAEEAVRRYRDRLPVTIVRPPAVFGPRDKDIFEIFKYANKGWRLRLGGGPRFTSIVYVKDLIAGLLLAAKKEEAIGQTYFMCNDDFYAIHDLEDNIAEILGKKLRTLTLPLPLAYLVALGFEGVGKLTGRAQLLNLDKFQELKATHWICDNRKTRNELGFSTNFELKEAFKETADWYHKNGWL